jgi:hypothetical protein
VDEDVRTSLRAKLALFGACLAIFFTAFELKQPLVSLGPLSLTDSELAAAFFFLTSAIWATADPRRFFGRRVLDLAVVLFLAGNFVSVVGAIDKASAVKFSLRMTFAALVYVGVSRLPRRSKAHLLVAATAGAALIIVAVVGVLENYGLFVDWTSVLSHWHEGVISFGAFYNIRVSSTLPFPTALAMYIELALPLALAAGLWLLARTAAGPRRRLTQLLIGIAIVTVVAAVTFTYTRSGYVAVPVSMLTGAAIASMFGYPKRVIFGLLFVAAVMVSLIGLSTLFSNKMASRLGVAEQTRKFGAEYTILDFPANVELDQTYRARLRVKNTSDIDWKAAGNDNTILSYRWFNYPENSQYPGISISSYLPRDVKPGELFEADVEFTSPADPGRYILVLEGLQAGTGWFSSSAHVKPAIKAMELSESGSRSLAVTEAETDFVWANPPAVTPPRSQLWKAALKMWQDHPVVGVGADQYRFRYTEYMDDMRPDDRVRTNNVFLEALATTGLVGFTAMLFMLGSAAWYQWGLLRKRGLPRGERLVALALPMALVAYLAHGLLDNFLWQTGITFLFFAELGLTAWLCERNRNDTRQENMTSFPSE